MAELTILVPSRGRPKNAVKMYEAFRETCTADTKLLILVDSDDPTLSTYYSLLYGVGQVLVVEPGRRGMVAALQRGFDSFRDHIGFAVGFMGDDHLPRTHGWDTAYLETLRRLQTGFVYGNDLYQGEAIATQVAMTTDIPDALGYMCPPEFDHLCVDVVWQDWGKAIDRLVYLDKVVVEHMHYLAGKARIDEGYGAVNNPTVSGHDISAYNHYNSPEGNFERDVSLLKALLPKTEKNETKVNAEVAETVTVSGSDAPIEVPTVEFAAGGIVQTAEEVVDEPYQATVAKKRGRPAKKETDE